MALIKVDCPIDGCTYTTGEVPEAVCVALLNTHALQHATPTTTATSRVSGPKLVRPMVSNGIALEEWNMFRRRGEVFAEGSGILVNGVYDATAAHQLFQCADDNLGDAILKVDPEVTRKDVKSVLATMKKSLSMILTVMIGML